MLRYRQEDNYWKWWYKETDGDRYFCTNDNGEGVFLVDLTRNDRKQIVGTCDFTLNGVKDPRARIRSWMKARFQSE